MEERLGEGRGEDQGAAFPWPNEKEDPMTERPRGVAPVAHPKMSPPSLLRETSLPVGSPAMVELATDGDPRQHLRGPSSHPCPALDLALARTISSVGCHAAGCYASERGHSGLPHRRLVGQAPCTPGPPLHLRPRPHLGLSSRATDGSHGPREGRVGVQVMVHQLWVAPAQPLRDVVCAHHVVHVNPPPHARTLGAWRVTGTVT